MNRLDLETRRLIIRCLVEGQSIRETAQTAYVSKNSVAKLLIEAGRACADYQDKVLRDVPCRRVQVDAIWSFVNAEQKNAGSAPQNFSDTWTWSAICTDTKLALSWRVDNRSSLTAIDYVDDLRSRLAQRVHLSSDGKRLFLDAGEGTLSVNADYAILAKIYGKDDGTTPERQYKLSERVGAVKSMAEGSSNPNLMSISDAEQKILAIEVPTRRSSRLISSYSKKIDNHAHSIALHFMYYNFCRTHKSMCDITPTMAAGVTDRRWNFEEILAIVDDAALVPKKRVPKRKRSLGNAR